MSKITKLALVVGHRKSDNGAINKKFDVTEWQFNKILIASIMAQLEPHIRPTYVLRDDSKDGYNKLPAKINTLEPDHIIEFHCNAATPKPRKDKDGNDLPLEEKDYQSGTEMLYYFKSERSKVFAEMLNNTVYNTLNNKKRDLKPLSSSDQNGYHLLKNTKAPCVIFEPFFLSSNTDTANALVKIGDLAREIAKALNDYFREK